MTAIRLAAPARSGRWRLADHRSPDELPSFLWVKALHIVFVASWFAGLFYLPRLFVNLATVPADSHAERERLLLMARKLYRFASLLMVPALALGLVLWLGYGIGSGRGNGWLHAKLLLVVRRDRLPPRLPRRCCASFEQFANQRSERWFRVFNEVGGAAVRRDRRAGGGQAVLTPARRMPRHRSSAAPLALAVRGADRLRQPVPVRRLARARRSVDSAFAAALRWPQLVDRASTSSPTCSATCRSARCCSVALRAQRRWRRAAALAAGVAAGGAAVVSRWR